MVRKARFLFVATLFSAVVFASGTVSAADLIRMLTSQLGVTESQATGGAGVLLRHAKGNLGTDDFNTLAAALPPAKSLIAQAPTAARGSTDLIDSSSTLYGGAAPAGGRQTALADHFKLLGLQPAMIGRFVPVLLEYARIEAGPAVRDLLQTALRAG